MRYVSVRYGLADEVRSIEFGRCNYLYLLKHVKRFLMEVAWVFIFGGSKMVKTREDGKTKTVSNRGKNTLRSLKEVLALYSHKLKSGLTYEAYEKKYNMPTNAFSGLRQRLIKDGYSVSRDGEVSKTNSSFERSDPSIKTLKNTVTKKKTVGSMVDNINGLSVGGIKLTIEGPIESSKFRKMLDILDS